MRALLGRLLKTRREPLDPADGRVALCALMVRIARSDHDYAAPERAVITARLVARYDLSDDQAAALLAEAEATEAEAPDTVRFTRAIKDAVAHDDRQAVIEDLWAVVLADGSRDHAEDGLMRLVASLLGIEDTDSAMARQRAGAGL